MCGFPQQRRRLHAISLGQAQFTLAESQEARHGGIGVGVVLAGSDGSWDLGFRRLLHGVRSDRAHPNPKEITQREAGVTPEKGEIRPRIWPAETLTGADLRPNPKRSDEEDFSRRSCSIASLFLSAPPPSAKTSNLFSFFLFQLTSL